MKKVLVIEGMTCGHCKMRVEKALNAVEGVVSANVDLEQKNASVELSTEVADSVLIAAVDDAGYDVVEVK